MVTWSLKVKITYLNLIACYHVEGLFQVWFEGIVCGSNDFWLFWEAILYASESYIEISLFLLQLSVF